MFELLFRHKIEIIDNHNKFFKRVARLRYKVYCELLNYIDKDKFPDELETDIYDNYSEHIVARIFGSIAGYVRIIHFTNSYQLPITKEFGVSSSPGDCEISRLIIEPKYLPHKILRRIILESIIKAIKKQTAVNNNRYVFAVMEEWLIKSFKKRGYDIITLGEGRYYMGAKTIPVKVIINEYR